MPLVQINDKALNAAMGDNLLALARRHALHIWFVCDGRGLCQTCECRVLSGAENLSPASKIELDSMSDSRREKGYRLACQSQIAQDGLVSVISIAEELRRQTTAAITGFEKGDWIEKAGKVAGSLTRFALDFTRSLPSVTLNAFPQLMSKPPNPTTIRQYLRDTRRVMETVLRDTRDHRGDTSK